MSDKPTRYKATIRCQGTDCEDLMQFMEELAKVLIDGKTKSEGNGQRNRITERRDPPGR